MDEETLADLAASIKATGLIQPIIVREIDGGYQLIAGERRLRATKLAGLDHISAIVRDVNSYEQAQMALVENIQREDLNPVDRAESYRALLDQLGLTQAELANRLGEDRSGIANHLRLLELPDDVRQHLRDGWLTLGHAKVLAGVADGERQSRLAEEVVAQGLSVRALEQRIETTPAAGENTAAASEGHVAQAPDISPHLKELETAIARQLALRVQVKAAGKGKRGRLVIHYSSLDEFDSLVARLGVTLE